MKLKNYFFTFVLIWGHIMPLLAWANEKLEMRYKSKVTNEDKKIFLKEIPRWGSYQLVPVAGLSPHCPQELSVTLDEESSYNTQIKIFEMTEGSLFLHRVLPFVFDGAVKNEVWTSEIMYQKNPVWVFNEALNHRVKNFLGAKIVPRHQHEVIWEAMDWAPDKKNIMFGVHYKLITGGGWLYPSQVDWEYSLFFERQRGSDMTFTYEEKFPKNYTCSYKR